MHHKFPYDYTPELVTDPGAGGTVTLPAMFSFVKLTSAAAEGRTIPAPHTLGQRVIVFADVATGVITLTVGGGYDFSELVLGTDGHTIILEAVSSAGTLKWRRVGGQNLNLTHTMLLNADCIDQCMFIADRAYDVVAIYEIHAVAGNDAGAVNMQVTKDDSTDAPGAGNNLLTNNTNAGFDMKGTANTMQTGTLTATSADLRLAAGDRLSVDFAGTVTTLAGVVVTVVLRPLQG
jgi:hypothetical protein